MDEKFKLKKSIYFFLFPVLAASAVFFIFWEKNNIPPPTPSFSNLNQKMPGYPIMEMEKNISPPVFSERVCDIRNYGAIAGGTEKNTLAINSAISDCFQKGGGIVYVPEGKWLTGNIKLQSNINLKLEKGAEIVFSENFEDYLPVVFSRFQGIELYNFSSLIYAKDAENIAITGKGKLTGNGNIWHKRSDNSKSSSEKERLFEMAENNIGVEKRISGKIDAMLRPSFIELVSSKNILLSDFSIETGPMWTIHPTYSENITIKNLKINTAGPNTDGIALDSSKNVLIENSQFSTGDDAISIKSGLDKEGRRINRPSENIIIRNCQVSKAHSGVSIGSEMSGGVKNVFVSDMDIIKSDNGFRIKSTASRGGIVENIQVEGIKMREIVDDAIILSMFYNSKLSSDDQEIPRFKDIRISQVSCQKSTRSISLKSLEKGAIENITLKDIRISSQKGVSIEKASDIVLSDVIVTSREDPAFDIKNSKNIHIQNPFCEDRKNVCLEIKGTDTDNIAVTGDNSSDFKKKIELKKGALPNALSE